MILGRFGSFLLLMTMMLLTSQRVLADGRWYHVHLKSQDGVGIVIDSQFVGGIYEPYLHQRYDLVDNVWINVHTNASALAAQDRLEAHVFNYRRSVNARPEDFWELDSSVYIRLHWNGSNFTGQWIGTDPLGATTSRMPISSQGALGNYQYRQEVVVTVYKNNFLYRLVDPVSNSPYFKFSLNEMIAR